MTDRQRPAESHPECAWPNCTCSSSRCYAARPAWKSEELPGQEFDTCEELFAAMKQQPHGGVTE